MGICDTCRYWIAPKENEWDEICKPIDMDTYDPMVMPFEVRECKHPQLVKFERTTESNGFSVSDGSGYLARLCTGPYFGCVRHKGFNKDD